MFRLASLILTLVLVASAAPGVAAQDDDYHTWLRELLASEYGLSGGTWTFDDNETTVLQLGEESAGVAVQAFSVADRPFARALRLTVAQAAANSWERTVRFNIQNPVQQGDALLLAMWLRHTWPADQDGLVEPIFEQTTEPYTKSLQEAYSVSSDWSLFLIPFEAVESHAAGAARFQLNMGRQRQITELGGLALLNYGSSVGVADLPTVVPPQSYGGRNPEAPWRALAQARIERHRKGALRISVVNEAGLPMPEVPLRLEMTQHAFGFGTAISTGRMVGGGTDATYKAKLEDLTGDGRTFNIAVLENALKWGPWESDWPVSKSQKASAVAWLMAQGMDVRGHVLVWPGWQYLPDDLYERRGEPEYVSSRIREHIQELAGFRGLKGIIRDWDVINEPAHVTDLRDEVFRGTPGHPTGEEVYAEWFDWAAKADPAARLFINEYGIVSTYGPMPEARSRYRQIIRDLIEAGAPLHGIGIQGHMGNPLTPIDTVYEVIDKFAEFGRAISITEYDAAGVDEELAAGYLRDFLTVVYSHPAVESFLMWGFWDGAHWRSDAPLFRQDWSLKPSGEAFLDLVFDEWWTRAQGHADQDGVWLVSGHEGTYEVSTAMMDAHGSREVDLLAGDTLDIVLTVTGTSAEQHALHAFSVDPAYPNPAADRTIVSYTIPRPEHVTVALYDMLGRRIRHHELGLQMPGRHTFTIEAQTLSSGTYVLRLKAGTHHHTGRISFLH